VKAFSFALERVLDWRRVEALLEENKLEQIWARVRSLAGQDAELERGLAVAEDELSARARTPGESLSAAELWALTAFRRGARGVRSANGSANRRVGPQTT